MTGREHDRANVTSSTITSDARFTSSRLDNGCYGRQPLKPNSVAHSQQLPVAEPGQEISKVPIWPGTDTLVVAYQRFVHGN